MITPETTVIGFIGIGVMGRSMARNLHEAGYTVRIFTRTRSRAESLIAEGLTWCDSVAACAARADVVITIVGFPADVREVYFGEGGILAHLAPGATAIDMTTSSPALAREIHARAAERGIAALDAPVSGGDTGAREARLSIMVGGDRSAFEAVRPILEVLGANIVHQGPAGSGQHAKMANQIAIAATMLGVCEALAYARRSGLDSETVLSSIAGGAAGSWSLSNLAPRIIAGDFEPGFFVKHFIKDMTIALDSARAMGLATPALALAKGLYEKLAEAGGQDDGTQALYKLYADGASSHP